jgi:hypothetical protein
VSQLPSTLTRGSILCCNTSSAGVLSVAVAHAVLTHVAVGWRAYVHSAFALFLPSSCVRTLFEPWATSFTFRNEDEAHVCLPAGHVVAVRVTSEDANDGFKPTCGLIEELSFRSTPEVWGYFSVKSGGGIHEFSDSQVH